MVYKSNAELLFFIKIPALLFCLLPFFLITGPFLSDLSISLISIFFLAFCTYRKNFSYFKNKYFYFFLVFWFYLVFNSLVNNFNLDSFKISIFFFRYGVFVVAIVHLIEVDQKFIKYFFYSLFFCLLTLIADGYYQYFFEKNILDQKMIWGVSSFFGNERILGSYLARLMPIFCALYFYYFRANKKSSLSFLVIFILIYYLIFITGERAAFFFINLSCVFIILFSNKFLKKGLLTIFICILLITITSFIKPEFKKRMIDTTLRQMQLIENKAEVEKVYFFSREHTAHYITAYKMFVDNKILGVGVKNFRHFCDNKKYIFNKYSCSNHPHNTYLQILSETGILGFLFLITIFLSFLSFTAKHIFNKIKGKAYYSDFQIFILSGLLIYLWPIVPTGNFFNNWLCILMFLNLPFLILSNKIFKN